MYDPARQNLRVSADGLRRPTRDRRMMTTSICPTVCEAGLPSIAYDHLNDPDAAHRAIAEARQQGPLAMGPHGAEILSYELVRTVLRDPGFTNAVHPILAAQGLTSGPLWDRITL
jgi:hypothetical protein